MLLFYYLVFNYQTQFIKWFLFEIHLKQSFTEIEKDLKAVLLTFFDQVRRSQYQANSPIIILITIPETT